MLAASDGDDDDVNDTVEASAFNPGERGECGEYLGRKGERNSSWQAEYEAWL